MTAPKGHNSGPISADRLKSFIERIEKLIEERKAIGGDIRDVFSEAKGVGYDVATMRKVVALRAMDAGDRAEMESLIDVYMHALGDGKRKAVEAMQQGAGTREAARTAGIAVGAASQLRTGVHGIANGEHVHETPNDEHLELTETSDGRLGDDGRTDGAAAEGVRGAAEERGTDRDGDSEAPARDVGEAGLEVPEAPELQSLPAVADEAPQEVGTGDPRCKANPEIDLTIPQFLKRERVSP